MASWWAIGRSPPVTDLSTKTLGFGRGREECFRYHYRSRRAIRPIGAIQLLPEGLIPENLKSIQGVPLNDQTVERALAVAGGLSFAGDDLGEVRLSLAGAQEKSAFLWKDGSWQKPLGATPSTHIFKLPLAMIGGLPGLSEGSLENEWLCSRILAAYGLPVAHSSLAKFGHQRKTEDGPGCPRQERPLPLEPDPSATLGLGGEAPWARYHSRTYHRRDS